VRRLRGMRRTLLLLPLVLIAAACGGKSSPPATTSSSPPSPAGVLGGDGDVLYSSGGWAVVTRGTRVAVARYAAGRWTIDTKRKVKVSILGPNGTAASIPQVAAEVKAPAAIVEDALWVDGKELLEKGGGLHPNDQTMYGAPDTALSKGVHVAIAYGRTATTGSAVRWTFRVV
jgi:hypothetical protein